MLNAGLLKHPLNWLTVGLMALIFAMGAREVGRLIFD